MRKMKLRHTSPVKSRTNSTVYMNDPSGRPPERQMIRLIKSANDSPYYLNLKLIFSKMEPKTR